MRIPNPGRFLIEKVPFRGKLEIEGKQVLFEEACQLFGLDTIFGTQSRPQQWFSGIKDFLQIGYNPSEKEWLFYEVLTRFYELKRLFEGSQLPSPSDRALMFASFDYYLTDIWEKYLLWVAQIDQGLTSTISFSGEQIHLINSLYAKVEKWEKAQIKSGEVEQQPKRYHMHLYPLYWELIASTRKKWEGRAYNPASIHKYGGIKEGDILIFTEEAYPGTILSRGARVLQAIVGDVSFGPLVGTVFPFIVAGGEGLQPEFDFLRDAKANPDAYNIYNIARYYEIPKYPERIAEHGFLAIELREVRVLTSDSTLQ